MFPIRTILHPTDFSPQSQTAFQVACALTRDYGARLVLLHVKPPEILYGEGYLLPPDPEVIRKELQKQLNGLTPSGGVRAERMLREGDAVHEIQVTAEELQADLIVLGTHGRTGIGRILLGSVAEGVLRRARCPVLTIKTPLPEALATTDTGAEPMVSGLA